MDGSTQETLDLGDIVTPPDATAGALVKATHQTIARLFADGRITEFDAARVALAIELAEVIAMKRASKRASTIGQDAKVLSEILDGFREDAKGVDDDLVEAMERWDEVIVEVGLSPAPRRAAATPSSPVEVVT